MKNMPEKTGEKDDNRLKMALKHLNKNLFFFRKKKETDDDSFCDEDKLLQ